MFLSTTTVSLQLSWRHRSFSLKFNFNSGKSSRVSENDLRNLIADEIGTLIRDSNSFKLIQINSYCGKTGVGEFNSETVLQIDEYISKANLVSISRMVWPVHGHLAGLVWLFFLAIHINNMGIRKKFESTRIWNCLWLTWIAAPP